MIVPTFARWSPSYIIVWHYNLLIMHYIIYIQYKYCILISYTAHNFCKTRLGSLTRKNGKWIRGWRTVICLILCNRHRLEQTLSGFRDCSSFPTYTSAREQRPIHSHGDDILCSGYAGQNILRGKYRLGSISIASRDEKFPWL